MIYLYFAAVLEAEIQKSATVTKFPSRHRMAERQGDQAARRPHMMSSICGRQLTIPLFGVRGDRDELIR